MNLYVKVLNDYITQIHQQNVDVGWWDDTNPDLLAKVQLISTEAAEATEAERKDLMDNHLKHRKGGEVELADVMTRTLDVLGYYKFEVTPDHFEKVIESFDMKLLENRSVAALHGFINVAISSVFVAIVKDEPIEYITFCLLSVVYYTAKIDQLLGYDIESAMIEKIEYNKHRADHKRENRQQVGGKAF